MADSQQRNELAPEIKRGLLSLLKEYGMDQKLVGLIADMQPYKIQKFEYLWKLWEAREEHIKERAREAFEAAEKKEELEGLTSQIRDPGNYAENAPRLYKLQMIQMFIKTEMHEVLASLNSQDRTSFMIAEDEDGVIF